MPSKEPRTEAKGPCRESQTICLLPLSKARYEFRRYDGKKKAKVAEPAPKHRIPKCVRRMPRSQQALRL